MRVQLGLTPRLPERKEQADPEDSLLDVVADEIVKASGEEGAVLRVRELLKAWKRGHHG